MEKISKKEAMQMFTVLVAAYAGKPNLYENEVMDRAEDKFTKILEKFGFEVEDETGKENKKGIKAFIKASN